VLKFVCNGTKECWDELDDHLGKIHFLRGSTPLPPVWIMPVGATIEDQSESWIADLNIEAMKRGYNVANRVQCFIFKNQIGR
jgi:hypothetical protein